MTREEIRDYEAAAIANGVTGAVMMESAGSSAADWLVRLGSYGPVTVMCGGGNNGGDGYVVARRLHAIGLRVVVIATVPPEKIRGDALLAFNGISNLPIERRPFDDTVLGRLRESEWIVDAILGTGATGSVREPARSAIDMINASKRNVLAIDLPSGLDANTGLPLEPAGGSVVEAHHTVTFIARKYGFDLPESRRYTGQVHVVSLGIK